MHGTKPLLEEDKICGTLYVFKQSSGGEDDLKTGQIGLAHVSKEMG